MADGTHTIVLRAGYAAWGRLGTGRAGWHAVSEDVRMPVTYIRMAERRRARSDASRALRVGFDHDAGPGRLWPRSVPRMPPASPASVDGD